MAASSECQTTSEQLKIIRDAVKASCENRKEEWKTLYERLHLGCVFGKDPHKENSYIGKEAPHHLLNSDGIREESSDNTPIHQPSIIPKQCNLRFWLLTHINDDGSFVFDGIDLAQSGFKSLGGFKLSDRFSSAAEMKNICNVNNYSSKLTIGVLNIPNHFWVKSMDAQSGSALVEAFKTKICTYIMRYRQAVCVQMGAAMVVIWSIGSVYHTPGPVGIGFCNLVQCKKEIDGHQMLHFDERSMENIHFEFYGRGNISMDDIAVAVMTYRTKKNKLVQTRTYPLELFGGNNHSCAVKDNVYDRCSRVRPFQNMNGFGDLRRSTHSNIRQRQTQRSYAVAAHINRLKNDFCRSTQSDQIRQTEAKEASHDEQEEHIFPTTPCDRDPHASMTPAPPCNPYALFYSSNSSPNQI